MDNYEKKSVELRKMLIGDALLLSEVDNDKNKLEKDFSINDEKLKITVDTIFRKAQNEPTYCAFYCTLV